VASTTDVIVSLVGSDVVAFAQCCALDATVFPHSSLPTDATQSVLFARLRSDGPVVGFVATRSTRTRLEIIGLAVDAEQRGHGLGGALLSRACREAAARGLCQVSLCVAVSNARAIRLYEREGFRVTRRLHGYYRSGDAYQMAKPVTP
jgi:ribosomal protein S18 acetylase RimI-like enzyme